MKYLFALLAFILPATAALAADVTLASQVLVEHTKKDADGKDVTVLEEPKVVTPGDKLVFRLTYKNVGLKPAEDFVITNPIPAAVSYAGGDADGSVVSVDGGKTWGALASLKVAEADGKLRGALPADVTHVRWNFPKPIPQSGEGTLSFRVTVK